MKAKNWKEFIWKKFWYVEIIDVVKINNRNNFKYKCICGNEKICWCTDMIKWKVRSCWCMMNKMIDDAYRLKHWMAFDRFYKIYHDAKKRCENSKVHDYNRYWWRWIKMEWKSFEDFKNDMYESYLSHVNEYWEKDTTIDRIDCDWNYCKENCRWATQKEQANNKRNNIVFNWKTIPEIAKELWISVNTAYYRYHNWTLDHNK